MSATDLYSTLRSIATLGYDYNQQFICILVRHTKFSFNDVIVTVFGLGSGPEDRIVQVIL